MSLPTTRVKDGARAGKRGRKRKGALAAERGVGDCEVDGKFFRPADAVVYGPSVRAEVEAQETQINRKRECFRGTAKKIMDRLHYDNPERTKRAIDDAIARR